MRFFNRLTHQFSRPFPFKQILFSTTSRVKNFQLNSLSEHEEKKEGTNETERYLDPTVVFFPPTYAFELITTARLWYIFNGEYPPVGYFQTRLFFPRIGAKRHESNENGRNVRGTKHGRVRV